MVQPYFYSGQPGELSPDEVIDIVDNSTRADWVHDLETSSFSYRKNLLITACNISGDRYVVSYGPYKVGELTLDNDGFVGEHKVERYDIQVSKISPPDHWNSA